MTAQIKQNPDFQRGYATGMGWQDTYWPGGPWHYFPKDYYTPSQKERAQATVDAWKAWHLGFGAALKERGMLLKGGPVN